MESENPKIKTMPEIEEEFSAKIRLIFGQDLMQKLQEVNREFAQRGMNSILMAQVICYNAAFATGMLQVATRKAVDSAIERGATWDKDEYAVRFASGFNKALRDGQAHGEGSVTVRSVLTGNA